MARLYLVRHGRAATGWGSGGLDPGLDAVGLAQAEARAEQLADNGPLTLLSSPLRRARETAAALERRWKTSAQVDPRIGEIQTAGITPERREKWLKTILQRRWPELGTSLERWRNDVLEALSGITRDTVVFSHFVAINVVVGHAVGEDRVTCFRPENCSCSVLEVDGRHFRILELGSQGAGKIL